MDAKKAADGSAGPARRSVDGGWKFVSASTIIVALLLIAVFTYHLSAPGTRQHEIAGASKDLLTLAVSGIVFKVLLDAIAARRARLDEMLEKERDFLRRMRAAHVRIAYAREVMRAEDSATAYIEQCRHLVHGKHEFEEIEMDLRNAPDLFRTRNRQDIAAAVKEIVDFITGLLDEYKTSHGRFGQMADASLRSAIGDRSDMPNTVAFLRGSNNGEDFPETYDRSLRRSKNEMRRHVYRTVEATNAGPDAAQHRDDAAATQVDACSGGCRGNESTSRSSARRGPVSQEADRRDG